MKLLIVLSIKDYQERVARLLHDAGVKRFSVTDITGYRKREENLGWFAAASSSAKTNSVMLFSFLAQETAEKAIASISGCNVETDNPFPVHAFMLDVESFSKMM
jgi:nitrogen regulatory protein PII